MSVVEKAQRFGQSPPPSSSGEGDSPDDEKILVSSVAMKASSLTAISC
jgi:hypothetical protein